MKSVNDGMSKGASDHSSMAGPAEETARRELSKKELAEEWAIEKVHEVLVGADKKECRYLLENGC